MPVAARVSGMLCPPIGSTVAEEQQPEQLELMHTLVEMSAERCYQNAERTLSVWVRTALALMVFGMAIDRFGLLLHHMPGNQPKGVVYSDQLSTWCGFALIALGVIVSVVTGLRFAAYAKAYQSAHGLPARHGPYMATFFAVTVAIFGVVLLGILFAYTA